MDKAKKEKNRPWRLYSSKRNNQEKLFLLLVISPKYYIEGM